MGQVRISKEVEELLSTPEGRQYLRELIDRDSKPPPSPPHQGEGELAEALVNTIISNAWKYCSRKSTEGENLRNGYFDGFKAGYLTAQGTGSEGGKPKVVCFCGSTRFAEWFMIKRWELEKQGVITFGINILPHNYFAEGDSHGAEQEGVKHVLDELHKRKIDLSDEVFILNVGGYIGESTRNELNYALQIGKPVKYLEPQPNDEPSVATDDKKKDGTMTK